MANIENINVGLAANDKKGDPLRDAMQKANRNFSALNTAIQGVLDGKGQASGYASLGTDGRLLAAQAPIVYAPTLPTTTHDLNTYVTPGTFYQAAVAGATAPTGVNYPVAQVGFLEVIATGNPVQHVYTTREASPRRFWRSKYGTTAWSPWKEASDTSTTLSYQGGMAAAQDLNNYTQRGMWIVGSSANAASGTNFPIGQSGSLIVYSVGVPGGTAATGCTQVYNAANSGQMFTRSFVSGNWTPWVRSLDASQLGVAGGVGTLDGVGRQPVTQFPLSLAVATGTDANTLTSPGVYYTNSDAQGTAALNWPEQLAGTLLVEAAAAGNSQVTQTYTTRNGTGGVLRTYKRVRFGTTGVWGGWQQQARFDDAMTHVYLGAAGVDCNALIADNTYYTIDQAGAVTSGSNWPPTSSIIGGGVEVRRQAATRVFQTVTLLVGSNMKPRIFFRYGDPVGNSWQNWTMISSLSSVGWLPTANCGDVYVDGVGWHRWNGSAYELASLAPLLPTVAHNLNSYTTPGDWYQGTGASATVANNYPEGALTGILTVKAYGAAVTQEYTARATANRKWWRAQSAGSTWTAWSEVASTASAMTHTFLTAATDANTLTSDNTFYTWTASAVAGGANFPGYSAAGYMQVFWHAATVISQELTLLVTGGRPLKFARFGNTSTGVWQPWKVTGAFNSAAWMPASDMGDILVDGRGGYRWNAALSAYVQSPPTPGYREGCKTEWASSSTLTVYPGRMASSSGEVLLELLAGNTRTVQTSGAFTHGATGNGLLTGARTASTQYYVFLLRRNSDGSVCVAFDTTYNCANRPATHSHYRRIGCFITDATNGIWAYYQVGNQFFFDTPLAMYGSSVLETDTWYSPNTFTPANVAHTITFLGWQTATSSSGCSLMNRRSRGAGFTAEIYILVAAVGVNNVVRWQLPMPATATPYAWFRSRGGPSMTTVQVESYIDHFED